MATRNGSTNGTASSNSSSSNNHNNENRVWIKSSAIDAVRNSRKTFHDSWQASFNSSARSESFGARSDSFEQRSASFAHRRPSSLSLCDSESDVGSVRSNGNSSHGRNLTWGWKMGHLLESTGGNVVVRVESTLDDPFLGHLPEDGEEERDQLDVVKLPASAINDGDVVLANDYPVDANGNVTCPHDLITLTHLHEPSVVECLSHRYVQDTIYTFTGPVLLALNPFQTLRGMYGESTMKRYWDHAENNNTGNTTQPLPPHVYAIADASFRSMMRKLDECLEEEHPKGCDQSILVSGESGAGKTVTAKFVMKYLAALSQRATAVHQTPQKRAYAIVAEQRKARQEQQQELQQQNNNTGNKTGTPRRGTSTATSSWNSPTLPSWTTPSATRYSGSYLNNSSSSSSSLQDRSTNNNNRDNGGLATATTALIGSASNSIEAQVLQSNPILESFGNARTVRNDNSSRFGKFIEIKFSRYGKLVGAQIETYLLEKVRLVTQSAGERNYHVFYELLSGGMDTRELRQFFLAATAAAEDFKITSSGTYDRRDGVSDKETYRALRNAMNTMKFPSSEQKDIFSVAAAILHASNLSFLDLGEESSLDERNVHLAPVCHLLGVTAGDLNRALCYFSITAGKEATVERALTLDKAQKGLEALLKATYGALFSYLVQRINESIAAGAKPKRQSTEDSDDPDKENSEGDGATTFRDPMLLPVASIGVLDIFGFESFTTNSFEQLCINYCNEALQQQFNAFVLKNEQEEYKREGIEWSFIEFPENQDVLDLIDKRGSGILSILDDQCRAPGTSDKSFALDVYSKCKGQERFGASRKQTAHLQFSVHHYAGPVEYSTVNFTEKNRDELPKEATDLLTNSMNPFVRKLAALLSSTNTSGIEKESTLNTPYKIRRTDSSSVVSRITVGGQFRRQLRDLRGKIDLTSPHYIRCLKPNDHLVPDHFDTAIVAEQLRCGGILEAVRVARAGFTQHYPHADFVKRYRVLAWRELKSKAIVRHHVNNNPYQNTPAAVAQKRSSARNSIRNSFAPSPSPEKNKTEDTREDYKALCMDLIKVLYKKVQTFQKQIEIDPSAPAETEFDAAPESPVTPSAKAKTYSYQASTPSWQKQTLRPEGLPLPPLTAPAKAKFAPWDKKNVEKKESTARSIPPPAPRSSGSAAASPKSPESIKMGIQMGKTKVFLRHSVFEALERMRSRVQTVAATKLNAIFRRYLARIAYIPVRNAFRREMGQRRRLFENAGIEEKKDQDHDFDYVHSPERGVNTSFRSSMSVFSDGDCPLFLLSKWDASQVREAIHNPIPRHEWGKTAPERENFRWVLRDGLWVRNRMDTVLASSTEE